MAARIGHLALAAMLISLTGCAMCVDSFDCQYAAYGGRLPRTDMVNGRVGSILDPAGGGGLTTHEMQTGEFYDVSAVSDEVYLESDQEDASTQPRTDAEMGEAMRSIEEPFDESARALEMDFDSVSLSGPILRAAQIDEPLSEPTDEKDDVGFELEPVSGTDEIDRAFDAIQDEWSTAPPWDLVSDGD